MSNKMNAIGGTLRSSPNSTEPEGEAIDSDNKSFSTQTDSIENYPQPVSTDDTSHAVPTKDSSEILDRDDTLERKERLARNRQKARIRRERKRMSVEEMIGNISALNSVNSDLRTKNQALIQELAKYGAMYWGGTTPTTNTLDSTSLRALSGTEQQQTTLIPGDPTRMSADVINEAYSQSLRNEGNGTTAAMINPVSLQDGLLSRVSSLQQEVGGSQRQQQQRFQQEAAAASMLLEMTQHMHSFNVSLICV